MASKLAGERRSVKCEMYFNVPAGTPRERVPFDRMLAKFIERKEHEGWRMERVVSVHKESAADADVYFVDCLLSRPAALLTLDVPDRLIPKLLAVDPRLRVS